MSIFNAIRTQIMAHQGQAQQNGAASILAGIGAGADTAAAQVNVEQALEEISRSKGSPNLNWRSSIVDLMKLLELDSSLSNRAELANELGYTGEKNGSAEMNIWLHRKVMEELEKSGGRVPDSLKS